MTLSLPGISSNAAQPTATAQPAGPKTSSTSAAQASSVSSAISSAPGMLLSAFNAGRSAAWRSFAGSPEQALESPKALKDYLAWHGDPEKLIGSALTSADKMKTYLDGGGDAGKLAGAALASGAAMKTYLASGGDIRKLDEKGKNLFHLAAQGGKTEALEAMIAHMKSTMTAQERRDIVNAQSHPQFLSMTPLGLAALFDKKETVELLLKNFPEQELDPNIKSAAGMTPAMYAQGNNFTGTLKALLQDQRTDVNARDRAGNTILDRSVDGGQLDNMTAILAHPGVSAQDKTKAVNHQYEVGGTRMTPLMLAEDLGNQEAFDAFLKVPGIDFKAKDDQGSSILARLALPGGSLKNIKAILQHSGVDADVVNGKSDKGNNPLHIAAMHNRADVIEALVLDGRLKPEETNKDGHTAVFLAGQLGHVDALRKMAEMKAEGKAAFDLNPSMEVKNSQDAYVNGVKIPKSDRVTLANKVATRGTAEVAKLLLEHGVDFNATNRVGIPLVYAAALEGNLPVFDVLRKHPSLKFDEPARNVNGVVGDSPSRTFLTYLSQMMVVYEERDDYKKAGLPNQFNTPSPGLDMEKIKAAFSHMERAYPVAKEIKAGIAKAIKDDLATQIKNREARDAYLQ